MKYLMEITLNAADPRGARAVTPPPCASAMPLTRVRPNPQPAGRPAGSPPSMRLKGWKSFSRFAAEMGLPSFWTSIVTRSLRCMSVTRSLQAGLHGHSCHMIGVLLLRIGTEQQFHARDQPGFLEPYFP